MELKDLAGRAMADLRSWRAKILSANPKISRRECARSLALDLGAWSAWILAVLADLKDLALAGRVVLKDLAGLAVADLRSWSVRILSANPKILRRGCARSLALDLKTWSAWILKPCKIFGVSFGKCERSSKRGVWGAKYGLASTLDLLVAPRQGLGRIHLGGLKRRFCRAPFLSHRG